MSNSNEQLVEHLKKEGVLNTPRIINAFRAIDRVDFVRKEQSGSAYADHPLPIGEGQTISQPYTVAFMLEKLQPRSQDKILDVGSGSGWTTALLSYCAGIPINKTNEVGGEKMEAKENDNTDNHGLPQMDISSYQRISVSSGRVVAVELEEGLCQFGASNTAKYFEVNNLCSNKTSVSNQFSISEPSVSFLCSDGSQGAPGLAPFDRILVSASTPEVPPAWKGQLKIGGRIVFPSKGALWKHEKVAEDKFKKEKYPGFRFVRLRRDSHE